MISLKSFFKTTLLGGFLVVLPVIILIMVLNWFFNFLTNNLRPITEVLIETAKLHKFIAPVLSVVVILLIFFIVGLLIRTRVGRFVFHTLEEKFLKKIPLYKLIKDTVIQLFSNDKRLFKSVALVNLYCTETLVTAFITDEHEDGSYTVFVPSGPAPTAGFVYHLKGEYVHKIDYPVDQALRTIISLGVGSKDLIKLYNEKKMG